MQNNVNGTSRGDRSRPVSIYDNFERETDEAFETKRNGENNGIGHCNGNSDTNTLQPFCPYTTVPQNIAKNSQISGKHAPTRNSLRHSRMIVMNRMGRVSNQSDPSLIRSRKLGKALVGFQIFFGSVLCCLAMWLFLWAPNLRTRDNPFWSGLLLSISGFFGSVLLCCCKKQYPGSSVGFCVYSTKMVSVVFSIIAAAACFVASIFALIHLIFLYSMNCGPKDRLNETCVCTIDENSNFTLPIKSYHYIDLSCVEVDSILTILLIFSATVNAIGGVISLWYVYLHWSSKYFYTYSKVRTDEPKLAAVTNI